jgi:light-dependent protochlorophyllide reductase
VKSLHSNQKSVIITGGGQGLGFQCTRAIARANAGWHIVVAARDINKVETEIQKIRQEFPRVSLEVLALDLAALASVRAFAERWQSMTRPSLQAIVCNAGIQPVNGLTYTQDGFETMFGVNHLGHFLLVNLLLNSLTTPARIVFVSSGTHDPDTVEGRFNPPHYENAQALAFPEKAKVQMPFVRRYSTSKLCNVLCAYELDRRLKAAGRTDITVNAFDPGAVPGTGLTRDYPAFLRSIASASWLMRLLGVRVETVIDSGAHMAQLILDPQLEAVSGQYFQGLQLARSSKESYSQDKALELWQASSEMTGLSTV